jgi:hypothetical protein
MKRVRIVQAVIVLAMAVVITSCSSSREYRSYPPRTGVSLIISSGPGYPISRYSDGRYYYRSPQGYMYWRGYDNRYYLDRRYINRSYYGHSQYNDWRRYHGRRR